MNNFARVVRLALRYRLTVVGALLSALIVAVLWGGNIGAVYPFMKVIFEGKSLQQWVDGEIVKARRNEADPSKRGWRRSRRSWSRRRPSAAEAGVELGSPAQSRLAAEQRAGAGLHAG